MAQGPYPLTVAAATGLLPSRARLEEPITEARLKVQDVLGKLI